ncbi:MAG: energy transducer TonB [Acetobacteraceae bacterium]
MLRGALFSLALHSALALLLVAGSWFLPGRGPPVLPVLAEVELVVQNTPAVGRKAVPAPASNTPATKPAAKTAPSPAGRTSPTHPPPGPPPGPPQAAKPPLPLPPPEAPPAEARQPGMTHQAPAMPREALAASQAPEPPQPSRTPGSAGTGLVSGSRVIPAALDRTVKNVPPAYPQRAVRAGEQGSVLLRVHIAADGSAAKVDIFRSSGYLLLDRAAQRAVGHWHFVPAREKGGVTVPSTMLLRIRFRLTNPEGGPNLEDSQ